MIKISFDNNDNNVYLWINDDDRDMTRLISI